jgi:hypothetical protein
MAESTFIAEGTLYDKNTRTVPGRKDPTQTYNFSSFKLEMKSFYNDKTYVDIPEFQCGKGVNIDDYSIGDLISVRFVLKGKKVSDTWHKTELSAIYVKHADMSSSKDNKPKGEILARDIPPPKREEVFVPPDPNDENPDDLPF